MYYERTISEKIQRLSRLYPVLLLSGARQTGKTALARHVFADYPWVPLDQNTKMSQAESDPALFLQNYPPPTIFDEIQRTPALFLEIKAAVDALAEKQSRAPYILTGSQPLALMAKVADSLAGRIGIMEIFPMTPREISGYGANHTDFLTQIQNPPLGKSFSLPYPLAECLLRGGMPAMALSQHSPHSSDAAQRLSDYIQTYLTKDLRDLARINDLGSFERFLRQLAVYSSKPFNLSDIGSTIGLRQSTLSGWLSLLMASYVFWQVPGYSSRLGRREAKRAKAYLFDSGLLAALLSYQTPEQIMTTPFGGAIFETAVANSIRSSLSSVAPRAALHHWRVDEEREVDLLIEVNHNELLPIEIKMTAKPSKDDTLGLAAFMKEYKSASRGVLVTACPDCFMLDKNILHLPWAAL